MRGRRVTAPAVARSLSAPAGLTEGGSSMDVYCRYCGEPYDLDSFHDLADERGETWAVVTRAFRKYGCGAFERGVQSRCANAAVDSAVAAAAGVMFDLLGADMDGAAAMLDDLMY